MGEAVGGGRGRLGSGLAPLRLEYKSDFGVGEGSEPEGGRKVKGGIGELRIGRNEEGAGRSGLNGTAPPSPTSAGGQERRRRRVRPRLRGAGPGRAGGRGAVGASGRLRGRAGKRAAGPPAEAGGPGTRLPPTGGGGGAAAPLGYRQLRRAGAKRDVTNTQAVFGAEGIPAGTPVSLASARVAQAELPGVTLRGVSSGPRPHPHSPGSPAEHFAPPAAPLDPAPPRSSRAGRRGGTTFQSGRIPRGLTLCNFFSQGKVPSRLGPLGFFLLFGKTSAENLSAASAPGARRGAVGRAPRRLRWGSPARAGRRGAGPLPVLGEGRPAGPPRPGARDPARPPRAPGTDAPRARSSTAARLSHRDARAGPALGHVAALPARRLPTSAPPHPRPRAGKIPGGRGRGWGEGRVRASADTHLPAGATRPPAIHFVHSRLTSFTGGRGPRPEAPDAREAPRLPVSTLGDKCCPSAISREPRQLLGARLNSSPRPLPHPPRPPGAGRVGCGRERPR